MRHKKNFLLVTSIESLWSGDTNEAYRYRNFLIFVVQVVNSPVEDLPYRYHFVNLMIFYAER